MAIPYEDSIKRTTAQPRFTDETFALLADRDAFADTLRYAGMSCYVAETELYYYLKGGIDNADWSELGSGGSGNGILPVADEAARDLIDADDRVESMLVYLESTGVTYQLKFGITNSNWYVFGGQEIYEAATTLTAGFSHTLHPRAERIAIDVGASAACASSNTPFGAVPPVEGCEVTVMNVTSVQSVTYKANNGSMGIVGYDIDLALGDSATFKYKSAVDRWFVKCRSAA